MALRFFRLPVATQQQDSSPQDVNQRLDPTFSGSFDQFERVGQITKTFLGVLARPQAVARPIYESSWPRRAHLPV